jgi:hypothetical protein
MAHLTSGRARLVLVLLAGVSGGCALLADLSQFDGDVNAVSDAAGADEADSSAPDGGQGSDGTQASDTPGSDTASEGQADAGGEGAADSHAPDADGGPNPLLGTSFCSLNVDPGTLLCADYDQGRADNFLTFPIEGQWSPYQNGGTTGINRADFAPGSAPASLIVQTVCTGTTTGCTPGFTQDQFTASVTAGTGVIFSLALKILNFDLKATDVSLFDVATPEWRVSLDLAGGPGGNNDLLEFHPDDAGNSGPSLGSPIDFPSFTGPCDDGGADDADVDAGCSVWVDVVMTIDLVGKTASCAGSPCITLTYDGQNAIVGGIASISPLVGQTLTMLIGANYIQAPAEPMILEYDNVKVEALP